MRIRLAGIMTLCLFSCADLGCSTLRVPEEVGRAVEHTVAFGRVEAFVVPKTTRMYEAQVRFLEVVHCETGARYRIEVDGADTFFSLAVPSGPYEISRVQISKGPFLSMADFAVSFQAGPGPSTSVGIWRFGLETPRHGRIILLSAAKGEQDRETLDRHLRAAHPELSEGSLTVATLTPSSAPSRLFEVMPYPRVQSYFRRHF